MTFRNHFETGSNEALPQPSVKMLYLPKIVLMWLRNALGTFDTKLFALVISLDKSSEEADSTKEEAAKMEKEYEVSKDSTKNEGQNAAGNSEEPGGTE